MSVTRRGCDGCAGHELDLRYFLPAAGMVNDRLVDEDGRRVGVVLKPTHDANGSLA
jgi:hypothetical protein